MEIKQENQNVAEWVLRQDFFFESIISNGNIKLFIHMGEWNNEFYKSVKKYQEKLEIWHKFCKKDFKEWTLEKDEEWEIHFSKLKQENYFGLYCYLDGVLNHNYNTKDLTENNELRVIFPLYFAFRKYNSFKKDAQMCVYKSSRQIASIVRRIEPDDHASFTLKEMLDWKSPVDEDKQTFVDDERTFFSHAICLTRDCKSQQCLNKLFPDANGCLHDYLDLIDHFHFRDEDHCSSNLFHHYPGVYGLLHFFCLTKLHYNFHFTSGRKTTDEYEQDSVLFKKNKIFSLV